MALGLEGARRGRGPRVGRDVLVPKTQPREDVRRHVLRVRHVGRDRRVPACRVQAVLGELRHIVRVDEVVCEPRMFGLRLEDRLEDRVRTALIRKGGIGGIRLTERDQRERVENRRFPVRRVAALDPIHRLRVSDQARPVIERGVILVVRVDGAEVVPLAGRARECQPALRGRQPRRRIRRGWRPSGCSRLIALPQ